MDIEKSTIKLRFWRQSPKRDKCRTDLPPPPSPTLPPLPQHSVCQFSGHSDYTCYVWGLAHVYEVTIFILYSNR